MNRRGQALVEFILILPIFLLLLFAIFDFGMIFSNRNRLEDDSFDIINLYSNGVSIDEIRTLYPDINVKISDDDSYDKIIISNNLKLITPGLGKILGNPYKIEITRFVPNE